MNLRGLSHAAAVAMILAAAPICGAQSADLERQLVELKRRLETATVASDRADLIARSDDLRKRLIAASPADMRVTTWWVDRAALALDMLATDGSDLQVLYAIPTTGQRDAVRARAQDALEHAQRAEQAAAIAVARLEAQLVDRSTDAKAREQAERDVHTLVDVEQARRIPYVRAMARMLLAVTSTELASRADVQHAARAFAEIPEPSDALANCAYRLLIGLSAGHAALAHPERAAELRAAAARHLRLVLDRCASIGDPASDPQPDRAGIVARARLALCRIGEEPGGVGAPLPGSDEHNLEAEARAALLVDRALAEPLSRTELFARAVTLLKGPVVSGTPAQGARACETIAAILPSDVPLDVLPPEATLAKAVVRAREGVPAARAEAARLLDQVIARVDASPDVRSLAAWEKAVLSAAGGDPLQEADALAAVFVGMPRSERALRAARRTVELFAAAQTAGEETESWRKRQPALRGALGVLAESDDPDAPRFREQLARLLIAEIARGPATEHLDALRGMLDRLPQASPVRSAAGSAVAAGLLKQLEARRESLLGGATPQQIVDLSADAARGLAFARTHAPSAQPGFMLVLGELMVASGDPQAAPMLSALVNGEQDRLGAGSWSRLRLALARAYRQAGDAPRALALLHEVASALEGAPGSPSREPAFWQAWAEMLDILQSANADGARTSDIRVQIRRLELLDPTFGGQPHAQRIQNVRAAVGTE